MGVLPPEPAFPGAPAVQVVIEHNVATMEDHYAMRAQIARYGVMSSELPPEGVRAYLERDLRRFQSSAVAGLGLQEWRDEHERELEAKAKRERRELVGTLYAAARNAKTLAEVQLLLADELEGLR